mmetsp:Transcript_40578/g.99767  ORF Transcript_40578/g.99767 Transcript_40578/m.99767 type:complete len:82 (-) Transcript_40578:543-788(-)
MHTLQHADDVFYTIKGGQTPSGHIAAKDVAKGLKVEKPGKLAASSLGHALGDQRFEGLVELDNFDFALVATIATATTALAP